MFTLNNRRAWALAPKPHSNCHSTKVHREVRTLQKSWISLFSVTGRSRNSIPGVEWDVSEQAQSWKLSSEEGFYIAPAVAGIEGLACDLKPPQPLGQIIEVRLLTTLGQSKHCLLSHLKELQWSISECRVMCPSAREEVLHLPVVCTHPNPRLGARNHTWRRCKRERGEKLQESLGSSV